MDGGLLMEPRFLRGDAFDVDLGSPFPTLHQQVCDETQAEATVPIDPRILSPGETAGCLQGECLQGDCLKGFDTGIPSESFTSYHAGMEGGCLSNGNFGTCEEEGICLEPANMQIESSEADPLKDPVFNYISDMLMDEDDERPCMYIDCTGYQAMANELTQIISDSSSSAASPLDSNDPAKNMDSWIDGLFIHDDGSSDYLSNSPGTPALESQPLPDEALDENLVKYLHNMQNDLLKTSAPAAAAAATPEPKKLPPVMEEEQASTVITGRDFQELQSFFVECTEYLKGQQQVEGLPEHPPYVGDLLCAQNFEAGIVRDVVEDKTAMENEEAVRRELQAKLMECAQAINADDMAKAYSIVNSIRNRVSKHGTGTERLGYYFVEALVARITGTGALLYTTLNSTKPPMIEMLKARCLFTRYSPNVRISYYFTNQTILDASEGASRVHIVDYGILYGFGWPGLIKAFAERRGGPPHLRLTGIDFPQPGFKPAERVEESGRRLAEYAKKVGVPFEFHAVATSKWESVQASTLFLRHDEVLIVSSQFRLRHLLDESVMVDSPRKLVLARIRSMRPKVFIQSVWNANYNAPFFISRFREALSFYSTIFEVIDTAVSPEHPERLLIEESIIGREILNVVACEGVERVERAETYKQWQSRTSKAGLEQLPLSPEMYAKSRSMLSTYHKNFRIGQDGNWLLLGWKETVLHAMSTWHAR